MKFAKVISPKPVLYSNRFEKLNLREIDNENKN